MSDRLCPGCTGNGKEVLLTECRSVGPCPSLAAPAAVNNEKPSPGPWEWWRDNITKVTRLCNAEGYAVLWPVPDGRGNTDINCPNEADRTLIASAPTLAAELDATRRELASERKLWAAEAQELAEAMRALAASQAEVAELKKTHLDYAEAVEAELAKEQHAHDVTRKLWDSALGMYRDAKAEVERLQDHVMRLLNRGEQAEAEVERLSNQLNTTAKMHEDANRTAGQLWKELGEAKASLAASKAEVERLRFELGGAGMELQSMQRRAMRAERALMALRKTFSVLLDCFTGGQPRDVTTMAQDALQAIDAALSPAPGEGE